MKSEKLLTVREVSALLGLSEREIIDLAESGKIPAYKIAGVYLRFKAEQIDEVRRVLLPKIKPADKKEPYSFKDRCLDFIYFNDFYIVSLAVIVAILVVIVKG